MTVKQTIPCSAPVVDPRQLQIVQAFKQADERKKELMYRQALALRCQKAPA